LDSTGKTREEDQSVEERKVSLLGEQALVTGERATGQSRFSSVPRSVAENQEVTRRRMDQLSRMEFRRRMNAALERARLVLSENKVPAFPEDVSHSYDDKFTFVERSVNSSLVALVAALKAFGAPGEDLSQKVEQMRSWACEDGASVSLEYESEISCSFLRTRERKESSANEHVSTFMGVKNTSKTVTSITEHFWDLTHHFHVIAFKNTDKNGALVLQERTARAELKTQGKEKVTPFPEKTALPCRNVNITRLLSNLDKDTSGTFFIDRTKDKCHTPRRNEDSDDMYRCLMNFRGWCNGVADALKSIMNRYQPEMRKFVLSIINSTEDTDVFVPVLPLFNKDEGTLISMNDVEKLMAEQEKTIVTALEKIATLFPHPSDSKAELISTQEVGFIKMSQHAQQIISVTLAAIDHAEDMLRQQLIEAVGKEITPDSMSEYMRFHFRKLYKKDIMRPFAYDVKRSGFAPEGSLSIMSNAGEMPREIFTCTKVREEENAVPMQFALGAATKVVMQGRQFCHGYLSHRFSRSQGSENLELIAHARQFSNFILMIGKIVAKDEFDPEYALIIQDKDRAVVPLMLDPLPSAKAFRDAIESLSPEQQAFAKAFRSMQLASTLFAVAIVEIKPQMEALLGLGREGALTKEIKLTRDLVKLFVEYQVPCDLMKFDGPEETPVQEKVVDVQKNVSRILSMIDDETRQEFKETQTRAQQNLYGAIADDLEMETETEDVASPPVMYSMRSDGIESESLALKNQAFSFGGGSARKSKKMFARSAPSPAAAPRPSPPSMPGGRGGGGAQYMGHMQQQQQQQLQQKQQQQQQQQEGQGQKQIQPLEMEISRDTTTGGLDYTQLPAMMDSKFEVLDTHAELRATTIKVSSNWKVESKKSLIAKTTTIKNQNEDDLKHEKRRAMDLLDALTRSGEVPLFHTQLHIVIASTHCFDQTVMDTVIQKNINPIERLEQSSLIVTSTITNEAPSNLIESKSDEERLQEQAQTIMQS